MVSSLYAMAESRSERLKLFKEAATNYGLKKVTIDKLVADDFDSLDTAELLTTADIESFELTKGQLRLLERWVQPLQTAKTASTPRPDDHTSGDVVDPEEDAQAHGGDLSDDELWDHTVEDRRNSQSGRAYLIQDYVSRVGNTDNETPVFTQGGTQLLLRTTRQKPAPETVTLAQWIGANARIMEKND